MTVNSLTIDFFDNFSEELCNILVSRPVDRHTQLVAIDFLEFLLEIRPLKPVVAEPVEVGELLIRKLIEFSIRTGGEGFAHEIVNIEGRQGYVLSFTLHEIAQRNHKPVTHMRSDEIGIVHPSIIDVFPGGPLGLELFNDITFLNQVKGYLDSGNFFKGFGENLGLIFVGRNGLRDDLDIHPLKGLGGVDEPFHLLHLLGFCQSRRLKLIIHPFLGCVHLR